MDRPPPEPARHRRSAPWGDRTWVLALLVLVIALVLGAIGWARWLDAHGHDWTVADVVYRSLQLLQLEGGNVADPPVALEIARFAAPLALLLTAFGAVLLLFREQTERFRIRRSRNHVIVCGLGRRGLLLARSLAAQGTPVVVVEGDAENDLVQPARDAGVLVLIGDGADPETLVRAQVERATHVVAACGDDSTNADIAVQCGALSAGRATHPLTCLAHVSDPELCLLLRARVTADAPRPGFRLDFFDVYERGADLVVREHLEPALSEQRAVHVVVVGGGRLGTALVRRIAWTRYEHGCAPAGLTITLVDRDADEIAARMHARNVRLAEVCALRPATMEVASATFERAEFLRIPDGALCAVLVCLDDDARSLSAALVLQRHLVADDVPIVVRASRTSGLPALVGAAKGARAVRTFPLLDRTCTPSLVLGGSVEQVARVLHERYRQSLGPSDAARLPADVAWDDLDDDLRESNRAAAADIGRKLALIGFTIVPLVDWDAAGRRFGDDDVEQMARAEHERWARERTDAGWRLSEGPPDPSARTSPWLVPWDSLPDDVRERDRDLVRAIPEVLAAAGLETRRVALEPAGG